MRGGGAEGGADSGVRREAGDLAGEPAALALQGRECRFERRVLPLEGGTPQLQPCVPGLDALLQTGDRRGVPVDRGGERAVDAVAGTLRDRRDARDPAVLCWGRSRRELRGRAGRVGGVRLLERGGVEDELAVAIGLDA